MSKKIKLIKNDEKLNLSDLEWVDKFYAHLTNDLKLNRKKAFQVIYYLQEHLPVFPDQIEQCSNCGALYDSYCSGHYSELTGKFYCSESCEPYGLHEKEEQAEIRKDAPYQRWKKWVQKEQKNYPALKGKEISDGYLRRYFQNNITPIDALNDIITKLNP